MLIVLIIILVVFFFVYIGVIETEKEEQEKAAQLKGEKQEKAAQLKGEKEEIAELMEAKRLDAEKREAESLRAERMRAARFKATRIEAERQEKLNASIASCVQKIRNRHGFDKFIDHLITRYINEEYNNYADEAFQIAYEYTTIDGVSRKEIISDSLQNYKHQTYANYIQKHDNEFWVKKYDIPAPQNLDFSKLSIIDWLKSWKDNKHNKSCDLDEDSTRSLFKSRIAYIINQLYINSEGTYFPDSHDEIMKAGEQGEKEVLDTINTYRKLGDQHIFLNKRIPKPGGGHSEVDLIVITNFHVYLLEVKNWAGSLYEEDEQWVVQKSDGTIMPPHMNQLKILEEKTNTLKLFLGEEFYEDGNTFLYKMVFTNKNQDIKKEIKNDPRVISRDNFDELLKESDFLSFSDAFLKALLDYLLLPINIQDMPEKIHSKMKIIRKIQTLRTFDHITLLGGKILRGDVLQFHLNSYCNPDLDTDENSGLDINIKKKYKSGDYIDFRWARDYSVLLKRAMCGNNLLGFIELPNEEKIYISNDLSNCLQFHPVAQKPTIFIPLIKIDGINIG